MAGSQGLLGECNLLMGLSWTGTPNKHVLQSPCMYDAVCRVYGASYTQTAKYRVQYVV
jgi:hypothetical protein